MTTTSFDKIKFDINGCICSLAIKLFENAIDDYHIRNDIDSILHNPYKANTIESVLYTKCWIDTVQWHLEDEIRNPAIDPEYCLALKRRIDGSNQNRTDIVELIDDYFFSLYENLPCSPSARLNTESPAQAIDRLSILMLKIYHMKIEVKRSNTLPEHINRCRYKLQILLEQQNDLFTSIVELMDDLCNGKKFMKVYRQMKMYNDPNLNPILYRDNQDQKL